MIGFNLHWLYAHLIGDYLLQNDWMAANKKKNSWICLIHITTYMIPFLFTSFTPFQLLLIALQHYIQDRTTFVAWFCKKTSKFQFDLNKFWGHVIVDNIFHVLFIQFIISYLC